MISIIPIDDIPLIKTESQFYQIIDEKIIPSLRENDILVIAHTPLSRIKGCIYDLNNIHPSSKAVKLSKELGKSPEHVEVILRESVEIVKIERKIIISKNKADVVCANAGVDQSNAGKNKFVAVPPNPNEIADKIREYIKTKNEIEIAVIISDTVGRALRRGAINIAVGSSGINAIRSDIGRVDLFGYEMRVSEVAIADELASAAELLQGQTDEGKPFIIIRGYNFDKNNNKRATELNRPKEERIFR